MKKVHIALAVADFSASLCEYTKRFGQKPCCVAADKYALWRTDILNFSISVNAEQAGRVRHLGFEDSSAKKMSDSDDINGMMWESFSWQQQRQEILKYYPDAKFND